jgi:serine/threonine protein kinase
MASATSGLTPGTLLDGKYEIVGLLGAGGMGEVYKALHVHLGAFRCVKVIKSALIAEESYRTRFLREARLATQVHHPNVAVVHDFAVMPDGTSFMVTEYIDGTTVREGRNGTAAFRCRSRSRSRRRCSRVSMQSIAAACCIATCPRTT